MKIGELTGLKSLHHAYIVEGSAKRGADDVLSLLEKRGVKTKGNPDVLTLSYTELLVDHAGEISAYAALKPLGETKYLVISFSRATREAQNALLKVTEEALGRSSFFFCVDAAGHLLPTLRSRCIVVDLPASRDQNPETRIEAEEFLKGSYTKRLATVDRMVAYIAKTQDRLPVRVFVKDLLTLGYTQKLSLPALRDLLDADRYVRMQGSSPKAVLGHLAVTLPRSAGR